MRTCLAALALATFAIIATSCFLTVPEPNLAGLSCDPRGACAQGFACIAGKCVVPANGEGEGVSGEGEGEGVAGEGEGVAGEGEGEGGGAHCGSSTACNLDQVCAASTCAPILHSVLPGVDPLLPRSDTATAPLVVDTSATAAAPFVLDTDVGGAGFVAAIGQAGGAPDVAVFVFPAVDIEGVVHVQGTRALALVSLSTITIGATGILDASANASTPGPGAMAPPSSSSTGQAPGGGNALAGGADANGDAGGAPVGNAQLVPLTGGAGGASAGGSPGGGGGGGAVFLFAQGVVHVGGRVDVNGGGSDATSGGGAGGSVLLEGASVEPGSDIEVRGGSGCAGSPVHGGADGGAPVPPAESQPCGDGAPGRVRVDAASAPTTFPIPAASCNATASAGTAPGASQTAPVIVPSAASVTPFAVPVGDGAPGAALGRTIAASNGFVVEGGDDGVRIVSEDGVRAIDDASAAVTSLALAVLPGGSGCAVAGSAGGARASFFSSTAATLSLTSVPLSDTPTGFGKAVAVVNRAAVGALALVASDHEVSTFYENTPNSLVPGGQLDLFDGVTSPPGTLTALAMTDSLLVIAGVNAVLLYDVAPDANGPPGFTIAQSLPIAGVTAVATDGHLVLLGQPHDAGCGVDAGTVLVLDLDAPQNGDVLASLERPIASLDAQAGELFGAALAVDNGRILVGAPGSASTPGSVYQLDFDPLAGPIGVGEAHGALGVSVAVDGNTFWVGTPDANGGAGGLSTF